MLPSRVAGSIALPAPAPSVLGVRVRRFQMPAAAVLTTPALGSLAGRPQLNLPRGRGGVQPPARNLCGIQERGAHVALRDSISRRDFSIRLAHRIGCIPTA